MKIDITLYSRNGCHLCDVMLENLYKSNKFSAGDIKIINIDSDPVLMQKYGLLIPVLLINGQEVCHGHYDQNAVEKLLNKNSTNKQ